MRSTIFILFQFHQFLSKFNENMILTTANRGNLLSTGEYQIVIIFVS